jgi:FkbM family methyltransferase
MIRFLMILVYCFINQGVFANLPELVEGLPWVHGNDSDAIYYAAPFLPNNPIILEAGVCGAEDSVKFKELWPKSIIYGFEAHPKHFENATKALKKLKGVFLYQEALFDYVGTITFHCSTANSGASSVLVDNIRNTENVFNESLDTRSYFDIPITVNCTTVDEWAKRENVSKIDYIWLDTEGAELYILQNALSILPSVRVISTEVNFQEFRKGMTRFEEIHKFLTDHGFVLQYIWGNPRWQAVAIFINNRLLNTPLNLKNYYLTPNSIKG